MENVRLSVSDCIGLFNQTLEYAYPVIEVEGEVAEFKINQGKYVFFNIKDEGGSLGCFMTVWQLRVPIEDGMKVVVTASPKLTNWGKFSLTVRTVRPSGEGAIKKSFDLLKVALQKEGLFAEERKRRLPSMPSHVAVIASVQSAGYADFIKIINERWGGLRVDVAHVQVQGAEAPDQIIRAIKHFNEQDNLAEVLVVIRGGGSADDLAAFNDEKLVRELASSRIPTLVGVGHETDETLVDFVADMRAATPSNAAQILVPDRSEIRGGVELRVNSIMSRMQRAIDVCRVEIGESLRLADSRINNSVNQLNQSLIRLRQVLVQIDPATVLRRGYALIRGKRALGEVVEVETLNEIMKARIENYERK